MLHQQTRVESQLPETSTHGFSPDVHSEVPAPDLGVVGGCMKRNDVATMRSAA